MFWDDEICDHLAYHTNLYSTQQTGKSIETTHQETETFFSIQMTMAIVKMSQYKMYWSKEFKYDPTVSTVTLKRYETLQRFLHASDNNDKNNPANTCDKLFKVRPLLDLVRNNCIKIEPEQHHSIAEQIIPAKTKRSGRVKQYNSKKIHKWGFKNMVCASRSGIIYNFFMYGGKHSAGTYKCGAENLVLQLVQNIPKHQNYQVFFDDWFSTFPLLLKLQSMGILATATFRMNRLTGCPLMSDKDFKKEGRWSFDYRTNMNLMLRVVKWHDNKAVTVASTFGGVGASLTKK